MRMSFVWVLVCMMAATGLIACGDGGGGSSSSGGNTGTAPRAFNLIPGTNGTGNGSTNVSLTPKLEWVNSKQVGDPTQTYTLQISSNSSFVAPLVYENTSIPEQTTSFTVPAGTLTKATTYYWRVSAVNSFGQTTASNAPWPFTTDWHTSTIVSAGPANGQFGDSMISATHDSSNKVHIAYVDSSNSNSVVKYATNVSGSWQITTIEAGTYAGSPVVAVDSTNKVHVCYSVGSIPRYATNLSGVWQTIIIPMPTNTGGTCKSIAVDSIDKVHVTFLDQNSAKVGYSTNASGSWQTTIVDNLGLGNVFYTSLAIDASNKAHICYSGREYLKYATNTTGTWQVATIDTASPIPMVTVYISNSKMAIDSNNKKHIIYWYSGSDYSGAKHAMNTTGSWSFEKIANVNGPSISNRGNGQSISVDALNNIYFGETSITSNASGSWKTEYETIGANGGAMTIDSLKYGHLVYYEKSTGDLKYTTNAP